MPLPIDHFRANLGRAHSLCDVAKSLESMTTRVVDLTDLYRAALVLGVSALDHFVHEFVRLGMLEVHRGTRATTDAHLSFKVPLSAAREAVTTHPHDDWLDEAVREAHSWLSFQQPDKIADAIRLVSPAKLWEEVGAHLGSQPKQVKLQLTAIVDRRNKIAHEADLDPTNPGERWPIDEVLVREALTYIDKVADAINAVAA
jgi:hypothetical protein